MNEAEQEVIAATRGFYDGIEAMVSGEGAEKIAAAWLHNERVTSRHPIDDWAVGWEQLWATWTFIATFGRPDRGGSQVIQILPYVYGEMAYAAVVFQASPAWGGERMLCTNVLVKSDGVWKVVHHHTDPSPGMQAALEKMLSET